MVLADPGAFCLISQATPGVTTWAGATPREWQGDPGCGLKEPLPGSPAQNSSPSHDTSTPHYLGVGDNAHAKVHEWVASEFNEYEWRQYLKDSRVWNWNEESQSYETRPKPEPEYTDELNLENWLHVNCADSENRWFIPGACESGHRIAKTIVCGKEWCPNCGKLNSMAHNRRFVRWLTKVQQFKSMRYFVFTIPENIRFRYRDKASLTELGRKTQELMKKHGFKRGLRRWHWFGKTGNKWHPHLNVFVEGRYMPKPELEALKADYADILGVAYADVKMKYKPAPKDMVGSLNYVTRATFLDYEWDVAMAKELRNFRNMVVWGRNWHDDPVWQPPATKRVDAETGDAVDIPAVESIVNHRCPRCGGMITWHKNALPSAILRLVETKPYGAGYYAILDRDPPPLRDTIRIKCDYLQHMRGKL